MQELVHYWTQESIVIRVFLVLLLLDIVTGTFRAVQERRINSAVSSKGMMQKGVKLMMIAFGRMFEQEAHMPLSTLIAGFFLKVEVESLTENLALIGVPLPEGLTKFFAILPPYEPPSNGKEVSIKTKRKLENPESITVEL